MFRKYGIDFCCGGGLSLSEACKKGNVETDELLGQLESVTESRGERGEQYSEWTPGFLIDYIIQTHHQFVRKKTEEVNVYAAKVAKVHGGRHPENVEIFKKFVMLSNELMEHMNDEEARVFPLIKTICQKQKDGETPTDVERKELEKELRQMKDEHETAGALMADIRELSNGFTPPQDACATYRILYQNLAGFEEDLHKHVHLENNILFGKMERLTAA